MADTQGKPKGQPGQKPMVFTPQREFEIWKGLTIVKDRLQRNLAEWENRARIIGSAYQIAYTNYGDALRERDKVIATEEAILFGAVTALTCGYLGSLGENMKKAGLLWSKIEDGIQAGISEIIDVKQMAITPWSVNIEKDPFCYQNSLLIALNDQWINVLDFFIKIEEELFKSDPAKAAKMDWKSNKVVMDAQIANVPLCKPPKRPNLRRMARDFETWMWAKWISKTLTEKVPIGGGFWEWRVKEDPKEPVELRLNNLGITKSAGIGRTFGYITDDNEVRKLDAWADKFLVNHIRPENPKEKIEYDI